MSPHILYKSEERCIAHKRDREGHGPQPQELHRSREEIWGGGRVGTQGCGPGRLLRAGLLSRDPISGISFWVNNAANQQPSAGKN